MGALGGGGCMGRPFCLLRVELTLLTELASCIDYILFNRKSNPLLVYGDSTNVT